MTPFQVINIKIYLSEDMNNTMPKGGAEEIEMIDKHADAIDDAISNDLDMIRTALQAIGYKVEIDT